MIDNFYEACILAEEQWVESLEVVEKPHVFRPVYIRNMNRLESKMRGNRYHKTTKIAFSILVAAALIMVFAIVSVAVPPLRHYFIETFSDHTSVSVSEKSTGTFNTDIVFGYLPEGFALTEKEVDGEPVALGESGLYGSLVTYHMETDDEKWMDLAITSADMPVDVDSEANPITVMTHQGITYLLYQDGDFSGLFWSENGQEYTLGGTTDQTELFKTAYSIMRS